MIDPREEPVYAALDALSVPYGRFEHAPAMTMEDCEIFDAGRNAAHCKNLFLANRQGTCFYLLLLVGDKPFKTREISRQIGAARLSFGTPEQLMAVLGLLPGSVTPMGLVNDREHAVNVLLDSDVAAWPRVVVHPNVNTASIVLSTPDLMRFLASQGNPVTYVTVCGEDVIINS